MRAGMGFLTGTDGNLFSGLGLCSKALKRGGQPHKAKEMIDRATKAGSYYKALGIRMQYLDCS